jgi:Flp pilus assembly protein TadG
MSPRVGRRLRDARGATIVEAAIVTPLFLLLTFSIVEFGAVFYAYLALENGVSQATRYGVTGNVMDDPSNPGTPLSRTESIKAAMRQSTPTLTINDAMFTFESRAPGAGGGWNAGPGGPGDIQKVAINYTWTFFTPLLRVFFPPNGQLTLHVESAMKNEGYPEP